MRTSFFSNLLGTILFLSLNAQAAPISNTVLIDRVPSRSDLTRFQALGDDLSYRISLPSGSDADLAVLESLPNRKELQIRLSEIPTETDSSRWAKFAARVPISRFQVTSKDRFPTEKEMDLLNAIPAKHVELVEGVFPSGVEVQHLNRWAAAPTGTRLVTFSLLRFPYPAEELFLLQISGNIALEFVVNYWPRYYQMDFMNRLPSEKQLIVRDIFPADADLQYLKGIQNLKRLVIESDFDPMHSNDFWPKLAGLSLIWVRTDAFPSASSLSAFSTMQDQARTQGVAGPALVLDLGRDLTATERQALIGSGVEAELRTQF